VISLDRRGGAVSATRHYADPLRRRHGDRGVLFAEKRYLVPFEHIPPHVRQAFIAAEDDAFYRHGGIDATGILRAFVNNIIAGGKVQGGSTITQQVVKSVLLSPQKSYERKLKEMILSLRLEHELPKDQILALYLNHIYLGSGAYGVAAAAREYFDKDIAEVSIAEAAMLAGLPQAPSRYSPYTHWPDAKARQRYVLGRMYEVGFIDRDTRDAALGEPISLASRKGSFQAAPYFVEHVRRTLEERYGRTVLYELGLRVHTTVDLRLQAAAERVLHEGVDALSERLGAFRAGFRNMEGEEREAYLRQQAAAFKGMEAPEPSFSYEALVTAVRGESARVQLGPFSGDLVFPPKLNGKKPRCRCTT
jgi:penicillin-binding protein 1A